MKLNHKPRRWLSRLLGLYGLLALATGLWAADGASPVAEGAKPKRIGSGYGFTEGPTANSLGEVFFTDQVANRIHKIGLDGSISVFLEPSGRSNGLYFGADGILYACADGNNEVWAIAADGSHQVRVSQPGGVRLNGPNDLVVLPDGGIYFTDPYYQRSWFAHKEAPRKRKGLFYLAPGAQEAKVMDEAMAQPNGIALGPDGQTLYVSDIDGGITWRYRIAEGGQLVDKTRFCLLGSDGMCTDSEGNVYLTGKGVSIYNSRGEKIDTIRLRDSWTANVCFGGPDRRTLFITASSSVYSLPMAVAGNPGFGK